MNRSKIEWCDHTWNPITGCRHDCQYCYARRMTSRFAGDVRLNLMAKKDYSLEPAADGGKDLYVMDTPMINETGNPLVYPFGFEPTLHKYRMDIPGKLKMGNNIFVGAMSDIFGNWVPDEWIKQILNTCKKYPIHNYMFLTKNPERYLELYEKGILPNSNNMFYGATVTQSIQLQRATKTFTDLPVEFQTFFSIEPIFENVALNEIWKEAILQTDWIIIGAQTGREKDKVVPKAEWIKEIVVSADAAHGVPVFMKDSLISIVGEENMRRDFPKQLQHSEISPKMKKKLFDVCSGCKVYLKKSDMIVLLARSKRGEQPKQFGFMCKECFKKLCSSLGLDIPKLERLTEGIATGAGDGDG